MRRHTSIEPTIQNDKPCFENKKYSDVPSWIFIRARETSGAVIPAQLSTECLKIRTTAHITPDPLFRFLIMLA